MSVRILLVDDSKADLLRVRRALERDPDTKWEVEQVSTAEEGLEHVARHALDVVLMDFHLPGMNGLELLHQLREQCTDRPLAAVVLTGTGSERVAVEAMKAGAQDYLLKESFSPERLRHSLHAARETVRLQHEVEQRRRQTERAERAAREALAVRDELFALATHDLKGPLQIITFNARLLESRLPQETPPSERNRLGSIARAAMRMGELIDHFLEVTRSQEQPLRRERMDLSSLVRAKVQELQGTSPRHTFQVCTVGVNFWGQWERASLERVLDNLLGNAVKYSPAGGCITVTLTEEPDGSSGLMQLSVEDGGVGIPQADLPRVFERFHRGGNVVGSIAGTGVGLASTRRLVELHGGTIEVESTEGHGSVFTVRLPRALMLQESVHSSSA
ncbi:MAG TPA: hybrid sensor histidine kinase/response regulator [Myxococcaceae bacterium]|jgi:signal transduction histidine kinase